VAMSRIIAIDYGRKRTGVAVSDPMQMIAGPLTALPSADIVPFLEQYCETEDVECIVVGEPKQMDYTASDAEKFIIPFLNLLKKKLPNMKIERYDERFTSVMASRTIIEAGIKKMARRNKLLVDAVSAVIILQSYMEMKQMQNRTI